jgi:N-methylhydantoinase A
MPNVIVVAIDIGGTFTDLIGFDTQEQRFLQAKSLTTPSNLVQGIIDCLNKSGLDIGDISELIHGSTTAINTLIERKGAKTGLIVTRGTRDVYAIGRGNRPESYNLFFQRPKPLVSRALTREINGRLLASGDEHEALDPASLAAAIETLKAEGVEAVAVCLLHSYVNPTHERLVGEAVSAAMPDAYLSLSHEILREYREYERMSTTVVNAYIGPKVGGYVANLESNLEKIGFKGNLSIMRSNGGVMTPGVAFRRPVAMMESGPVGGIIASARFGQTLGITDVISFDMGGTTAKASLVKDGPICYRGGGTEPTITDANVVLGRLDPDNFLGGTMKLDAEGARAGVERVISGPLGMDVIAAAKAIVDIGVLKMSLAVREVSVEKGYDPRDFALVASGGAGPLHVMAIARELYIPKVIIPLFPSHFSALGMLLADERHDFVRTFYADLSRLDFEDLLATHAEMAAEARGSLRYQGEAELQTQLDIRYVGQEFTLSVPVERAQLDAGHRQEIRQAFDALYEHRYSHSSPDEPVEVVSIRVAAVGKRTPLAFPAVAAGGTASPARMREVYLDDTSKPVLCPVYEREQLPAGAHFDGPAIVQEHGTTTVMFAGDSCTVAATGELIITVGGVA